MLMQGNPIMAFIFPVRSTVTILKEIPNKIKGKITDFKNFAKKKKHYTCREYREFDQLP